jgi:hypothetical protein
MKLKGRDAEVSYYQDSGPRQPLYVESIR